MGYEGGAGDTARLPCLTRKDVGRGASEFFDQGFGEGLVGHAGEGLEGQGGEGLEGLGGEGLEGLEGEGLEWRG